MKLKSLFIAAGLSAATTANAALIAGWDFSQYVGDGINSIDGVVFTETLSANYSSLAAPGPSSAIYGTLFYDGQFSSTNVTTGAFTDEAWPTATAVTSNLSAGPFDNFSTLTSNGQAATNALGFLNTAPVNIVFRADVSSAVSDYATWVFSFGAITAGSPATLNLAYSVNGSSYTALSATGITATDTAYTVALPALTTDVLYIQVGFGAAGLNAVTIDNVAIGATVVAIPEPSSFAAIAGVALLGFAAYRRRRA